MTSQVSICNIALSHLGNRARVASIAPPDGSVEADLCATFFQPALDELIEMADWSFARKRATLAVLTTNESDLWTYAYARPSDCMVERRIVSGNQTVYEEDSATFVVEDGKIYTNQENAKLIYTRSITDVSILPPTSVTAFGYLLASYLAGPILKNETGAKAAADLRTAARAAAAQAAARDANRDHVALQNYPSGLAARHGVNPQGQALGIDALVTPGSGYAIV